RPTWWCILKNKPNEYIVLLLYSDCHKDCHTLRAVTSNSYEPGSKQSFYLNPNQKAAHAIEPIVSRKSGQRRRWRPLNPPRTFPLKALKTRRPGTPNSSPKRYPPTSRG